LTSGCDRSSSPLSDGGKFSKNSSKVAVEQNDLRKNILAEM
jgi:hypothetical protein